MGKTTPAEIQIFLVATDGSESAGRALDVAAAIAKAAHGTLRIVTAGGEPDCANSKRILGPPREGGARGVDTDQIRKGDLLDNTW